MKNSNIEWTDHTFNPWMGCTKVSPGCDNCYAEARMDKRLHKVQWGPGNPRQRTSEKYWKEPTEWNKQRFMQCAVCGWRGAAAAPVIGCGKCGSIELDDTRAKVFCASLADVFDNEVPGLWRQHLMSLVARTPNLDWLFLTKRIGNARKMLTEASMHDGLLLTADDQYQPPANLWIGATITSQAEADRDIPKLLATPAAKRFLSMEPLLGPVDITKHFFGYCPEHDFPGGFCLQRDHAGVQHIDWVIVGGESGPGARPMHPDWATSLRDQCQAAGVPFLFKQWGEWAPTAREPIHPEALKRPGNLCRVEHINQPDHYAAVSFTGNTRYHIERVGKKAAGRMLDGRAWDEVAA